jgi:hypothetical protein
MRDRRKDGWNKIQGGKIGRGNKRQGERWMKEYERGGQTD